MLIEGLSLVLVLEFIISFWIAFSIGANDETMASLVGSKFISVFLAALLGAIMDFIGAVTLGYKVEETIGKGLLSFKISELDALIIIITVALWLVLASLYGWPISTTHAVVGSCIGLGLLKFGIMGVNWNTLRNILLGWIAAPFVGFLAAIIIVKSLLVITSKFTRGLKSKIKVYYLMSLMLLVWASISAYSRGANDIANATALLSILYGRSLFVRVVCGLGMSLGLIIVGRRVLKSVGLQLSSLDPLTSLSVQISVALTMLIGTLMKLPLSGTQVLVGAIIGVSKSRGVWMNISNLKRVVLIWILTFPITCITTISLSKIFMLLYKP